jgi:glyoxylase-like metal-dependent hydrolase (beta-lactamase superfamily II)/rhodanese-related sulfurtransferase
MKIEQIYTGCLAQGAYYIQSEGEAAIIDPLRETAPYLERAEKNNAKIKYIFETHFHADFVSGHVELAKKTGATIVYGPNAQTDYKSHIAQDGEKITLGKVTFTVLHTPGHTPESTTYLLKDENGKDHAIFTGDTLFIGDVGRPDLAVKSDLTKEDLAGMLFDSLRNKIMPLGDDVIVYPAHGAGSACGKNMSKETSDRLGHQKESNYALRSDMTKDEFVREVTAGILPPPQYFAKNAMMNKSGASNLDDVLAKGNVPLNPDTFESIANHEGALVLDTRSPQDFAKSHVPNSIFIGIDGSFAPWVGALIPDLQQPIIFIAPNGREEEVVTRLSRVGYDNTLGFLAGGIEAWANAGKDLETLKSISAKEFAEEYERSKLNILDVRKPGEFESGHVDKAINFPLDFINEHMEELNDQQQYHIHCAGGYRSVIAASILKARGFSHLVDIAGGFADIGKTAIPTTTVV